jgi:hypothetical protein
MGPMFARSDYLAFRKRNVPFVFLSTGTPWYYHTPHDDPDRLDFAKLQRVSDYVKGLVLQLRDGPREGTFDPGAALVQDARVLDARIDAVLSGRAGIELGAGDRRHLEQYRETIQGALKGGRVDAATRSAMQGAMVIVFERLQSDRRRD